jgi:hypothetical protein
MAVTVTWGLNRSWTFRDRRGGIVPRELGLYLLAQSGGAAINLAVYTLYVAIVPTMAAAPALAVAAGSLPGMFFNYLSARHLVSQRWETISVTPVIAGDNMTFLGWLQRQKHPGATAEALRQRVRNTQPGGRVTGTAEIRAAWSAMKFGGHEPAVAALARRLDPGDQPLLDVPALGGATELVVGG